MTWPVETDWNRTKLPNNHVLLQLRLHKIGLEWNVIGENGSLFCGLGEINIDQHRAQEDRQSNLEGVVWNVGDNQKGFVITPPVGQLFELFISHVLLQCKADAQHSPQSVQLKCTTLYRLSSTFCRVLFPTDKPSG